MTRALLLCISLAALTACSPSYTCGDVPDAVCQSVSENLRADARPCFLDVARGGQAGSDRLRPSGLS